MGSGGVPVLTSGGELSSGRRDPGFGDSLVAAIAHADPRVVARAANGLREGGYRVVAQSDRLLEALGVAAEVGVDLIVAGADFQALREDRARHVTTAGHVRGCLLLSRSPTAELFLRALGAGAHGLLRDDCDSEQLVAAAACILRGGVVTDAGLRVDLLLYGTGAAREIPEPFDLSCRQAQVLALLVQGMSNPEIAEHLEVSTETVKTHVRALLRKMDVSTRAAAAALAVRLNLSGARSPR